MVGSYHHRDIEEMRDYHGNSHEQSNEVYDDGNTGGYANQSIPDEIAFGKNIWQAHGILLSCFLTGYGHRQKTPLNTRIPDICASSA